MSLYALRARTGASSGRSRMGKMMMEAGDWLGHAGMVRGGVLTAQMALVLQAGESTWNDDGDLNLISGNEMMNGATGECGAGAAAWMMTGTASLSGA